MHGKDTDPSQKWYPWLAEELGRNRIKCLMPTLPAAKDPKLDEWVNVLEKTEPDNETILVGHSRGGVAILRYLENAPERLSVNKVILVAVNSGREEVSNKAENNNGFFTEAGYDFAKIRSHCDDFVVLHSEDDEWVPFAAGKENAEGLRAKFLQFKDRGHFGKKVDSIPEVLDEIISAPNN